MNVFVLFDDKWRWQDQGFFVRTFYQENKEKFTEFNKMWYWIYKTVNAFDCTDEELKQAIKDKEFNGKPITWTTKRQIPFLKKLKYVYADLDIAKSWDWQTREEKEAKKKILLEALNKYCEPTMVIDTSNGIQPLRRIDEDKVDDDTQKKYVAIINWIIERSKQYWASWDEVKDVTRVIRMPGYLHMKEEPYMVQISWGWISSFTLDELSKKFYKAAQEYNYKKDDSVRQEDLSLQFQEVESIDFIDLLKRAYRSVWRSLEVDRSWRMIIDWRLTGNFIGKTWWDFVASTSHEDMSGNRITAVAKVLSCTYSEAFKWIKEEFNIKPESELRIKKAVLAKPVVANWWPRRFRDMWVSKFSTWVKEIDENVWHIWASELVLLHWPSKNWKTFFTLNLANSNWLMWHKVAFFSLEMDRERLKTQQAVARAGIDRISFEEWKYNEYQWNKYVEAYNSFDDHFTIFDETDLPDNLRDEWFTLDFLIWFMEKLHKEEWYTMFIIDSLRLVAWRWNMNENQWESKVVKDARKLKNRLPISIVFIHHNHKWWWTFSWSQDLENFVDWRIEVKKLSDPDANWVTIFNQTQIRIYKERLWKELEFLFNYDRWNLIFQSTNFIKYEKD